MTTPISSSQLQEAREWRKKPVVIQAVQWTGNNRDELLAFLDDDKPHLIAMDGFRNGDPAPWCIIKTLEGEHIASIDDWIIKGVKGEFYPCKPDIFQATYEPAHVQGQATKPFGLSPEVVESIKKLLEDLKTGEVNNGWGAVVHLPKDTFFAAVSALVVEGDQTTLAP